MKNHKGLSYIELILAMSIMFILIGMVTFSIGLVGRANVNKGADKFVAKVNEARNMSLARGEYKGCLLLKREGSTYFVSLGTLNNDNTVKESETEWVKICQTPVEIQYYSGGAYLSLGDYNDDNANVVIVKFKQSTGELIMGPSKFRFKNGEKFTDVQIYELTGKAK